MNLPKVLPKESGFRACVLTYRMANIFLIYLFAFNFFPLTIKMKTKLWLNLSVYAFLLLDHFILLASLEHPLLFR